MVFLTDGAVRLVGLEEELVRGFVEQRRFAVALVIVIEVRDAVVRHVDAVRLFDRRELLL